MRELARSFPKSSRVPQLCMHPGREEQGKATARQLALGKSLEYQGQKSQCGAGERGSYKDSGNSFAALPWGKHMERR